MPADRQIHMGIKRLRNCVQNNISELIFTLHTPLEHQIKICVGRNCSCELQCLQCQCLESNGRVIVLGSGGVFCADLFRAQSQPCSTTYLTFVEEDQETHSCRAKKHFLKHFYGKVSENLLKKL